MKNYLKLIRIQNLVAMVLIQYLLRYSFIIPNYNNSDILGHLEFGVLVLSMVLIAAGAYVINDYFDIQVDTQNKDNKVIVGRFIKRRVALLLHILFTSIGVILGFYMAYKVNFLYLGGIMAISAYLLWDYSLRLKRKLFTGSFIVATLSAIFVFSITSFEVIPKLYHPESLRLLVRLGLYSFFAFMCSLMHEVIKDLRDQQGDSLFKIKTLVTTWGIPKSKEFVKWLSVLTAFMVIALSVYEFSTDIYALLYAVIFIITPLFIMNIWIYQAKNIDDFTRISSLNKFIILAGILSLYFFI